MNQMRVPFTKVEAENKTRMKYTVQIPSWEWRGDDDAN